MSNSYYDLYPGYTQEQWDNRPIKKCTCGTLITMGDGYPKHKHSDWCDIYEKENPDVVLVDESRD